ncbi:hypothetical protein LVB87_12915 [Lysobacter sp. KIS68-7]|uniref:hypothetical protein n=1 Tax=Lysobacter sp. KIS68-7 TaxID=2904252 RepID=UPI001E63F06B|nr:hypothetical protein [Lysobacter sp. KIS68-7]UHQ19075.1 hypothetical protein LVB87_12915 [Lysobacter sp. KIS68-7]
MSRKRFSIDIQPIDPQELDLLECLVRIDQGATLDMRAESLLERLVDAGMVDRSEDGVLALTRAGVDRCRSIHMRVASDAEATKVLEDRGIALAALRAAARET